MFVTTEDFVIKNKMSGDKGEIDKTEIRKIFPPDMLTNEFIDYIFDKIDIDFVNLHKIGVTGGKSSNC